MKISCIIPTCDRRDFLPQAINSVLEQSLPPDEIIIINNGREPVVLSDDLATKVKVFDIIPYAGVAQARNFGACVAQGDYLAFLDDDDLWTPEYLEKAAKAITQGAQAVFSRQLKLKDGEISEYQNPQGKINIKTLLVRNPGTGGPNTIVSKKAFFQAGGYDPKLPPSEDKAMVLELLLREAKIKVLSDNSVIVRIHQGPRLTDNKKIIEGIYQFTRRYRHLMNYEQYYFNQLKYFRLCRQDGYFKVIIPHCFYYFLFRLTKILRKVKSILVPRTNNLMARPSKTFLFEIFEKEIIGWNFGTALDAGSADFKNRRMFKTERYFGLDIDEAALKKGLKKYSGGGSQAILGDLLDLNQLPEASLELAAATNVLDHFQTAVREKVIKNLIYLVKPGGQLIFNAAQNDIYPDLVKNLKDNFGKVAIIYYRNIFSRLYEKIFEDKNGCLGSHPIAGGKIFRLITWLISRLEYLTCHFPRFNVRVLVICREKKDFGVKNEFRPAVEFFRNGIYNILNNHQ